MIIAGTMIINDIDDSYEEFGVNMSVDGYIKNVSNIARGQDLTNMSGDMHEDILGGEVDIGSTADSMFQGGFSGIRLITTPLKLTKVIIDDIAVQLNIDPLFTRFAFTALTIMIIFTIVYIVFRISIKT